MARLLLATVLWLALTGAAAATGLSAQSHRAVYELTLQATRGSNAITDLNGRLVIEWVGDCEGYVLNQRMLMRMVDVRGEAVVNDYQVTTWESLDGTQFRFNVRNALNGELIEEVGGHARLQGPGQGGSATFTRPEEATLRLPAGTTFPTEHTGTILRAARAGESFVSVTVFDGSGVDALYETFAVISRRDAAAPEAGRGHDLVAGVEWWPVHVAYYPAIRKPEGPEGAPDFEIGLRLFDNGVTGDLLLDYGDLVVAGALMRLEALPSSRC